MSITTFTAEQVAAAVPMEAAVAAVRSSFLAMANGDFELPLRTALADGQFLAMSAHHRPTRSMMVKTLSLNFEAREPAIVGSVIWTALDTVEQVIADASAITTLRTGAVTGVATDLLTRPDASTCAMIGAGGQAINQVLGVHAVRPLTAVTVADIDRDRAERLADGLRDRLGGMVDVDVTATPELAVRDKDIVCCATTAQEALFACEALRDDAHVNAIGAFRPTMRELPDDLVATAQVVVDDREASIAESGEVIRALAAGALREDDLIELGPALRAPFERRGRTVFKSVGLAIQDWAIIDVLARREVS